MRVRITHKLDLSPSATAEQFAVSVEEQRKVNGRVTAVRVLPIGAEFEHPLAFQLVKLGAASPVDDECREACGMDDEQIADAQKSYKRTAAGIHPHDFADFDRGLFIGYDSRGRRIPAPATQPVG